jgi:hypothetical protein
LGPDLPNNAIGGAGPGDTFTIYNVGNDDLVITSMYKRDGDPWLSWSPTAPLTIPPSGSQEITVSINWALVPCGDSDEQIVVLSNDVDKSPYPTGVFITVEGPPCPPDVTVVLSPDSTSVPRGGTLGYWVTATNNTNVTQCFEFWTNVTLPNGNKYPPVGELFGPYYLCLAPFDSRSAHLTETVPMKAPLGTYSYNGFVGPYPTVWDEDHFRFTVTTTSKISGPTDWKTTIDDDF